MIKKIKQIVLNIGSYLIANGTNGDAAYPITSFTLSILQDGQLRSHTFIGTLILEIYN